MKIIERIDFEHHFVVVQDDFEHVWKITNYIDHEGDECGPDEATALVCGFDDKWLTVALQHRNNPVQH